MPDRLRAALLASVALAALAWRWWLDPLGPGSAPFFDLIAAHHPLDAALFKAWYYLMPSALLVLTGSLAMSGASIWFGGRARGGAGRLPPWPLSPQDEELAVVLGELQHPVERRRVAKPGWQVIPARGLYAGIAVFGAVGSGKTAALMYPLCQQLFGWRAGDEERKLAGLVLEVKGDFCHQVRAMLEAAGRGGDYVELGIDRAAHRWQWNPLDAPWTDSYSLAYSLASLMTQLFGKGNEPYWQVSSTALVQNIIELHRCRSARGWVTLRDVLECATDSGWPAEFDGDGRPVGPTSAMYRCWAEARSYVDSLPDERWRCRLETYLERGREWEAAGLEWSEVPAEPGLVELSPRSTAAREAAGVAELWREGRLWAAEGGCSEAEADILKQRLAEVERWLWHDWGALEPKLRASITSTVSGFLRVFTQPEVARVFCPRHPPAPGGRRGGTTDSGQLDVDRALAPLSELIDEGKVLALNLPYGSNDALARAIGVLLKQSWLKAVLQRVAERPGGDFRSAAFVCDEYQNFATVGADDPGGDEKIFALTRQAKLVPVFATQSISSIRSVAPRGEAWRTLLQAIRTKVFLCLSEEDSAKIASQLCGQVPRMKGSVSINESTGKAGVSLLSGRAGGAKASMSMSKQYSERREALFFERDFMLLGLAEAIVLPFDGVVSHPARRCYLRLHFLDRMQSWFDGEGRGRP